MIVHVTSDHTAKLWPVLKPLLSRVVGYTNGCFEEEDIFREILNDEQLLWVAFDKDRAQIDAMMTTKIRVFPRRKTCLVVFVAGNRMKTWLPAFQETIERYAREMGATALEGFQRKGWARVWPGARITGVGLFKDL